MKYKIKQLLIFFHLCIAVVPIYLWKHKKTIKFIIKKLGFKAAYRYLLVKLFARAEDSGKSILDPLWKISPQLVFYPFTLEIEVTTKCNLRCIMCEHTYWQKDEWDNRDLSFEDFKRIVDQFPNLIWINLTGEGSPFLNKDYLRMIEYVKSRLIFTVVIDSFTWLDEKVARQLIKLGVDKVRVSIDAATKETYKKIRVGANFDRVMENIKNFIQLKKEMNSLIPELDFVYIVFKPNYQEIIQFIEMVGSLEDRRWLAERNVIQFVSLLEFDQIKDMVYEPPQALQWAVLKKGEELGIQIVWCHPSHQPQKKPPLEECIYWTEPYIMMGGYVVPCCGVLMSNNRAFLRKYSFGNILEKPFKEIWNSKRYRQFRKMVLNDRGMVPFLCKGCRTFDTTCRERRFGVSMRI